MPVFYGAIDLSQNELRNARVQNLGAAPSTPVTGQLWYDSTNQILKWWNGSTWIPAMSGSALTPAATVTTQAVGDAPVVGTSANYAREDHKHGREAFGATVTAETSFGLASAVGVATTLARSDHTHGTPAAPAGLTPATSVTSEAIGGVGVVGTSTNYARQDHAHDLTGPAVAALNMGSFKIINLLDPTTTTDAVTKQYVDNLVNGLAWKAPARAATTANISLSGTQTVDGVALNVGDRVLVKNQTSAQLNGIYVCQAAAWNRSLDNNTAAQMLQTSVYIEEGTTQADTGWVCTTNAPITINTTPLTFVQFTGAGTYTAGNGLTLTGNVFAVGQGTGILSTAGQVAVDTSVIATQTYAQNIAYGRTHKNACRLATTANITLSGQQVIDGVDTSPLGIVRVLVKNQTTQSQNGIYLTNSGAWTRDSDMSSSGQAPGATCYVNDGATQADTYWGVTTPNVNDAFTLDTNNMVWVQVAGANFIPNTRTITTVAPLAGGGPLSTNLTLTVGQFTNSTSGVVGASGGGTTNFLRADGAWVPPVPAPATVAAKFAAALVGTASPEVITHNLNTRDIQLTVLNGSSPYTAVEVDWDATTVNTATIRYNPNLGAGYRVVIVG